MSRFLRSRRTRPFRRETARISERLFRTGSNRESCETLQLRSSMTLANVERSPSRAIAGTVRRYCSPRPMTLMRSVCVKVFYHLEFFTNHSVDRYNFPRTNRSSRRGPGTHWSLFPEHVCAYTRPTRANSICNLIAISFEYICFV